MNMTVRAADPAAGIPISAHSAAAEELLTDILQAPQSDGDRSRRRLVGLAAATVAAAAVVAVPALVPGDSSPSTAQAHPFRITDLGEGRLTIAVDKSDFKDPGALERALGERGVRSHVAVSSYPAGTTLGADPSELSRGPALPAGCRRLEVGATLESNSVQHAAYRDYDDRPNALGQQNSGVRSMGTVSGSPRAMVLEPRNLPADGVYDMDITTVGGEVVGLDVAVDVCPD